MPQRFANLRGKSPSIGVSLIPLLVLAILLAMTIYAYGSDAILGASQIVLLVAAAVAALLAIGIYGCKWSALEGEIVENIRSSASAIIILLLIGAISGTWMVSGVVPTLICYGLEVLHPSWFLAATCIICSVVSFMTGSSWTTIATIGVALMGVGRALEYSEGWVAGAIISGAYFGDKFSILSDTTLLACSTCEVPLFSHIRYMLYTTIPTMAVTLLIFLGASLFHSHPAAGDVSLYADALHSTFHISPWLLLVPLLTGLLIWRKLPALVILFAATLFAVVALLICQPHLLPQLAGDATDGGFWSGLKGALSACYGATHIDSGLEQVNSLIATKGMSGMLNTIWLILCAMCFGGVMTGSGMLNSLTGLFLRWAHRAAGSVATTVGAGIFFNLVAADQYISIILTGRLFKDLYRDRGLEPRLLSRTVVDSATVTSVLIPWNSCGMTQATVLGVSTFTYLPYCLFNLLTPLVTILVALFGYKINEKKEQ